MQCDARRPRPCTRSPVRERTIRIAIGIRATIRIWVDADPIAATPATISPGPARDMTAMEATAVATKTTGTPGAASDEVQIGAPAQCASRDRGRADRRHGHHRHDGEQSNTMHDDLSCLAPRYSATRAVLGGGS